MLVLSIRLTANIGMGFVNPKITHSPIYGSHIAIGTILKELKSYFKYLQAQSRFDVIFWNRNVDISKMMLFGGTMKNLVQSTKK